MNDQQPITAIEQLETLILTIRGQKVILDADLARIYSVPTKALNQAVKRNAAKFPPDFLFRLTEREANLVQRSRSQIVTLNNRSQIVTGSQKHRDPRHLASAFTEHGAIMAANVLNSPRAVAMSVYVVRAFVRMRSVLAETQALEKRLAEIERTLLGHDAALRDLYQKLRPLLLPPSEPPRKEIGFQVKERRARYLVAR
jgi:hypothetical protein